MGDVNPRPRDLALDEAADWLLRLRQSPGDASLRAGFDAWLEVEPRHAEAWRLAVEAWSLSRAVGPADPVARRAALGLPVGRRPRWSRLAGWAVAAAAACLLAVASPSLLLRIRADHVTPAGVTRTVELPDGSSIRLDTASAVALDYGPQVRRVTLLSGRAYFDVAADRARPFEVQAADVTVAVTGTAFDVGLGDAEVAVAVVAGAVHVAYAGTGGPGDAVLGPGQQLRVPRSGGAAEVAEVGGRAAAWRRGRLMSEGATVAELVDELRRYRPGVVLLVGDRLADRRVTGVFDLSDPVHALRAIVEPHEGRVRQIAPWLLVVSGE